MDHPTGYTHDDARATIEAVVGDSVHGTVQTNLVLLAAMALSEAANWSAYIDSRRQGWTSPVPGIASDALAALHANLWARVTGFFPYSEVADDDRPRDAVIDWERTIAENFFRAAWASLSDEDRAAEWNALAADAASHMASEDGGAQLGG